MSPTFARYVLRGYLGAFAGILAAVLAIFLVGDFVDRAKAYTGPNWIADVAVLYGFKALVATQQLAPAALLLAAGIAVSTLRKRGELTAVRALSFGPSALYLPIGAAALTICLSLVAFDEWVVVGAGRRVDEITTQRFNRWGDWRFFFKPKQWFRKGDRIFHLRGGSLDDGYADVTVLQLTEDFTLRERLDARRFTPIEGTRWRLEGVARRTFLPNGGTSLEDAGVLELDLGIAPSTFRIQQGRPEQMKLRDLSVQIEARRDVGLPTTQYLLAMHNRFAYPLAGLPAALLAVGLALRPNRKGHLTAAIVEGLIVAVALWGMMVVSKTLVLSERIPAAAAAWAPAIVLVVLAAGLWLSVEGRLPKRRIKA